MRTFPLLIVGGLAIAVYAVAGDGALCPTAGLFGVPCPSCGLSRATWLLFKGEWRAAHAIHPLVMPVLVYLIVAGAVAVRSGPSSGLRSVRLSVTVFGVALIAAMTLLWLARWYGSFGGPVAVHAWRL